MRKDLLLSPWTVRHTGMEIQDDFPESIFFTGNGRMGVRGYLPCGREALPIKTGLYVGGIFGQIKPGITDFVNLPTPFMEEIAIDGSRAAVFSPVERELDMRSALVTMGYCLSAKGKAVRAEALCIHNPVAGCHLIAWIFMQGISHIAAKVAVSGQCRNLRIRGNFSVGNLAYGSVNNFC